MWETMKQIIFEIDLYLGHGYTRVCFVLFFPHITPSMYLTETHAIQNILDYLYAHSRQQALLGSHPECSKGRCQDGRQFQVLGVDS